MWVFLTRFVLHTHCLKIIGIQSFSCSVFSCIQTKYRDFRAIAQRSPNLVQMQEEIEQEKLCIPIIFPQCLILPRKATVITKTISNLLNQTKHGQFNLLLY